MLFLLANLKEGWLRLQLSPDTFRWHCIHEFVPWRRYWASIHAYVIKPLSNLNSLFFHCSFCISLIHTPRSERTMYFVRPCWHRLMPSSLPLLRRLNWRHNFRSTLNKRISHLDTRLWHDASSLLPRKAVWYTSIILLLSVESRADRDITLVTIAVRSPIHGQWSSQIRRSEFPDKNISRQELSRALKKLLRLQ